MKPRERFLTALEHGVPDAIPIYDMGVDEELVLRIMGAREYSLELGVKCLRWLGLDAVTAWPETFPVTHFKDEKGRRGYVDEWGRKRIVTEDGTVWYAGGVIATREDFESWAWPDPNVPERYVNVKRVLELSGDMAVVGFVGGPLERAALGRSHERFLADVHADPSFVVDHMRKVCDYWIEVGKIEVELGVDALVLADDYAYKTGPFFSPETFKRLVLPLLKREVSAFKKLGVRVIHHSDGYIVPLLPLLIEAGVDAVHSLEPAAGVDIGWVKEKYGDRLVLVGNIDCDTLLPSAPPHEVGRVVGETIAKAGRDGGYILSSSNSLHKACRVENVLAMVLEAKKWRYEGSTPVRGH